MTTSRAAIRDAIAALLTTALALPSGNVRKATPGAFRGATPVVLVLSGGSNRPPMAYGETQPVFLVSIRTYVLLGSKDGTWTNEDTETQLDAIEAGIAATVAQHATSGPWMNLSYNGMSKVEDVMTIDGCIYRRESLELRAECDGE